MKVVELKQEGTSAKFPLNMTMRKSSSASLDQDTEASIQAALHRATNGKTVIVVAHRLATIVACDQVVVLEAGKVAQVGRPRDLLATDGAFRDLATQSGQLEALMSACN